MIYITGDTHGEANNGADMRKLSMSNFSKQKQMTKNDFVIICGDFGLVWNDSPGELYWRKWLHDKNFTTLFIDGNHSNHNRLANYPVSIWNGGKVHFITDSIIHLMRGQVFDINGTTFFTMGGAESSDKQYRVEGISWWKEELPNYQEYEEAIQNLNKNNWQVDYVITHTTSKQNMIAMDYMRESNQLTQFFDMLEDNLKFKHWYFGHFHQDKQLDEKHTVVYNNIIPVR